MCEASGPPVFRIYAFNQADEVIGEIMVGMLTRERSIKRGSGLSHPAPHASTRFRFPKKSIGRVSVDIVR
jgi:hypothetical protein